MRSNGFIVLCNHTHLPTLNFLILHPLNGTTMVVQGWGYNSMICTSLAVVGSWMLKWRYGCWKEGSCWYEGRIKTFWHLPTFCVAIIINALNLGYWGCFITPSKIIIDCRNMGDTNWSNGYERWGVSNTTFITKWD
jgi:hypothetical protein